MNEILSHVPSLLPAGKQWKLVWHDEFDGDSLDHSKWSFRTHIMHQRMKTYETDNVRFDGQSNIILPLTEKDGHYFSTQLQTGSNFMDNPPEAYGSTALHWPVGYIEETKFLHKYGYYECRCKLPEQPGWWAAFWLQSPIIGATMDPVFSGVEVDIMENFSRDGLVSHNNHWNGYGSQHKSCGSGDFKLKETEDGFHTFGLEWTPEGYFYYVDGEFSWCCYGPVSDREQFILISTECMGYRSGAPSPELKKAELPDAFIVDYVRVFDEHEPLYKHLWKQERVLAYVYNSGSSLQVSFRHYGDALGMVAMFPETPDNTGLNILDNRLKLLPHKAVWFELPVLDIESLEKYFERIELLNTVPLLPCLTLRSGADLLACTLRNASSETFSGSMLIENNSFSADTEFHNIAPYSEIPLLLEMKKIQADTDGPAKCTICTDTQQSWSFDLVCPEPARCCSTDGRIHEITHRIKSTDAVHSATFSTIIEDNALILKITVKDPSPSGDPGLRHQWEQDCVEIFFDPIPFILPFHSPEAYHQDMLRLFVLPYASKQEQLTMTCFNEQVPDYSGIHLRTNVNPNGYYVEIKIQLEKLKIEKPDIEVNRFIGFDLVIDNAEGTAKATSAIQWSGNGKAHCDRCDLGLMRLQY